MFCYGRQHFKKKIILILAKSALSSGWLLHSQDYGSISTGCSSSIHFPGRNYSGLSQWLLSQAEVVLRSHPFVLVYEDWPWQLLSSSRSFSPVIPVEADLTEILLQQLQISECLNNDQQLHWVAKQLFLCISVLGYSCSITATGLQLLYSEVIAL